MSTRFRHLRLVRPWSSVIHQYFDQPESLQLRWGSYRPSKLLACKGECLGLATWVCPAAKEISKPCTEVGATVRYPVLLYAELAGMRASDHAGTADAINLHFVRTVYHSCRQELREAGYIPLAGRGLQDR